MIADHPLLAGVVLIAVCVVAVLINLHLTRAGSPVEQWARANGFKLISEERAASVSVEILGVTQQSAQIYRIVVHDAEGRSRQGRLEWSGRPLDPMHVSWDEPPRGE